MAGLYAGLLVKVYYMLLNQDKVFIFFVIMMQKYINHVVMMNGGNVIH